MLYAGLVDAVVPPREDYDPVVRILDDLPDVDGGKLEGSEGRRLSGAPSAGALDAVAGGDPSVGKGDTGWSCDEYLERQLRDMVRHCGGRGGERLQCSPSP